MYYPSSTTYTTQSYRKFKKQEDKVENTNAIQDYHLQRTLKQVEQLQRDLEQAKMEEQNSQKQRRQAEEKLYHFQLKYDDMNKECMNLREKIAKAEGDRQVIRAQGEGEVKALNVQINYLEKQISELKLDNEKLKKENEQLHHQVLDAKNLSKKPIQNIPQNPQQQQQRPQSYY
ncbi:unnamed protein product (macronuclear) [Paramecium tetraurelia]|uniref:Uncharacterized protein n=1 Tax=Paramecium tetraurelia TaxID=5888 RepID=A0CL46_PARTE|nr:uncharacterized protein GSPATT00008060001 [Paramecium tetraurelia]CAK71513.1 unnamed protein product [Paramecium tetraurelia]|eukprot:XP_001438910.1 hypothetical protein (macronuclear) [Paramecium tetraurelia strain d4-2]